MNDKNEIVNDAELRELFSRLRMEEELQAPRFMAASKPAANVQPAPARWAVGRTLAGAFLCAAAILAAVLYLRNRPVLHAPVQQTGVPVASITQWRPATDFLLNTPGSEMLRTPPTLDLRPYLGATPSRQHTRRARTRPLP